MKKFYIFFVLGFYSVFAQGLIVYKNTGLKDTVVISTVDSITFTNSMVVNRTGGVKDSTQLCIIDSVNFISKVNSPPATYKLNIKTFKRNGVSGVDADFCGLNAIGDALASIKDASQYNRYQLQGNGQFIFTDTIDFKYTDPDFGEHAIIEGKDWIDIEGDSHDSLVIAVLLPDNLAIDYGTYQPVMWNCNSKLSNATIIAKNCRYGLHFEGGNHVTNKTSSLDHLYIWHQGNYNNALISQFGSTGWTTTNAIGSGMRDGQTFDIRNCTLRSDQTNPMLTHTALGPVNKGGWIYLINDTFIGTYADPAGYHSYPINNIMEVTIENPTFYTLPIIYQRNYYTTVVTTADYSETEINANITPLAYDNSGLLGGGLRIKSKSMGSGSSVTLDPKSSAFIFIFGTKDSTLTNTRWGNSFQYGYEWRFGGAGMSGYAVGHVDVDEKNTARTNSLGLLLGDCSTNNKTLTVIIDGVKYNIVFNQNYTAQTNAQVIAFINLVIGTVANVDVYTVGKEYYPTFSGNKIEINVDTTAIKAGMGVVFNGADSVRIAKNSDGHIDGIAMDDFAPGQNGRIITGGDIFSSSSSMRFSTLEISPATRISGDQLGISSSKPGYFDISATPKVIKAVQTNVLKML